MLTFGVCRFWYCSHELALAVRSCGTVVRRLIDRIPSIPAQWCRPLHNNDSYRRVAATANYVRRLGAANAYRLEFYGHNVARQLSRNRSLGARPGGIK